MTDTPRPPRHVDLTVTGGPGGGEQSGYWMVTGPQDPNQVRAIIERAKSPDDGHLFFAWYLTRRTSPAYNAPNTHMLTIKHGFQPTLNEALDDLRNAWVQLLGTR